jgi:lantibiotic modifying enzyme
MADPLHAAFLLALAAAPQETGSAPRPYLEAARAAAAWIDELAIKTEHGLAWPADAAEPARIERTLYAGTPGIVLFLLELARASGDEAWLERARSGADDLVAALDAGAEREGAGLYTGVAGVGFVLHRVALASGDERYSEAARRSIERIAAAAQRTSAEAAGVHWGGLTDVVSGTAGTGLFLLYAAREMGHEHALELARAAGEG